VIATDDLLLVQVFGGMYAGYGDVLGVLALSMALQSIGLTAGIGLWAVNRPHANIPADICSVIITLTVTISLLQPRGVMAAALGDLAGKVVGTVMRYFALRSVLDTLAPPNAAT
jgi:O-antigen/teichoic acid export membrane protein